MKKAPFVGEIAREMRLGETLYQFKTTNPDFTASVNRDSSYLMVDGQESRERERGRCLTSLEIITHR